MSFGDHHEPFHQTIFEGMIPSSDIATPKLVSEKAHPNNYTVVQSNDAPLMHVDFIEYEDFFVFHADMPGFRKEDINVVSGGGILNIEAHRHATDHGRGDDVEGVHVFQERKLGKIHRSFRLPSNAVFVPEPVAKYKDGVLTIVFDKSGVSTKASIRIL